MTGRFWAEKPGTNGDFSFILGRLPSDFFEIEGIPWNLFDEKKHFQFVDAPTEINVWKYLVYFDV